MKISQREARRLQQQVARLENQMDNQRNAWSQAWPGGVHLGSSSPSIELTSAIKTARKLRHAVVVNCPSAGTLEYYALPLSEVA